MAETPGRTYAGEKLKVSFVPAGGIHDISAPTVTELNAETVLDLSCAAIKAQSKIGSTDSETIDGQAAICEDTNAKAWGQGNAEVTLALFRYFKGNKADPDRDKIFQALKTKGVEGFIVTRHVDKRFDESYASGDEVSVYAVSFDQPHPVNEAEDRTKGYIRTIHNAQVTNFAEFKSVA